MNVVYEDLHYVVVDKPHGVASHPSLGHQESNVLSLMTARGYEKLAPCHRLDKDTSGLLVLGRSPEACAAFQAGLDSGKIKKTYLALAQGVTHRKGRIQTPLLERRMGRDKKKRLTADTRYRRLRYSRAVTLLTVKPITGRPHQIRRHLNGISHPIACDDRWGDEGFNRWIVRAGGLNRMFLHAARLELEHPTSGESLVWISKLPESLVEVLNRLELPPLEAPWV